MKVLSVRQPWAWLIAIGCKTIENRTWERKFRGRFLIHASQARAEKLDGWQDRVVREYCAKKGITLPNFDDLPKSAIIGSVELYDIDKSEAYNDPFAEDFQMHWMLRDAKMFDEPIMGIKGKLFLWDYDYNEEDCMEDFIGQIDEDALKSAAEFAYSESKEGHCIPNDMVLELAKNKLENPSE